MALRRLRLLAALSGYSNSDRLSQSVTDEDRRMSVEGIWTAEAYGPFGWDTRGVFILEKGRVMGGDNRQYTMGTYTLSGEAFSADLAVHYYGPPRTIYGEAREKFMTHMRGTLKDGVIEGLIGRPDRPEYDLQFRMTHRMDLPALAGQAT